MNKHTLYLLSIALLLSFALLSSCDEPDDEDNIGVIKKMKGKDHVESALTLKVMTWNILGKNNTEEIQRQTIVAIIQNNQADIIAMIEAYGSAEYIANALNYYYYTPSPTTNLAIFSRYPIVDSGSNQRFKSI